MVSNRFKLGVHDREKHVYLKAVAAKDASGVRDYGDLQFELYARHENCDELLSFAKR